MVHKEVNKSILMTTMPLIKFKKFKETKAKQLLLHKSINHLKQGPSQVKPTLIEHVPFIIF